MQPTLTQVPPKRPASATATRAPRLAEKRLARTPPEPPPMVKRSKSKARELPELLEVFQVHPDQVQRRCQLHVLRLVGQPLDGAVDALLDLRGRHALDADEHLR